MSGLVLPPPENKQEVKYAPYKDETEMREMGINFEHKTYALILFNPHFKGH